MTSRPSTALKLNDLHHVAVPCRDAERSQAFYCDVLGFRPLPRPPFDFPGAWLYAGGMQIHLIQNNDPAPFRANEINSRTFHLAFRVDSLEVACQLLDQLGVPYMHRVNAGGIDQVFLQDPDGTNIELTVTTDPELGYEPS